MNEIAFLERYFDSVETSANFTRRAINVPGYYRLSWRLSVAVLIVSKGRAQSVRLEHLHVLWWAVRSRENSELFERWINGDKNPNDLLVRFDPALSGTLDLAIGQGLIEKSPNGTIKLTSQGKQFSLVLDAESDVLKNEKEFFGSMPNKLTQTKITELLER